MDLLAQSVAPILQSVTVGEVVMAVLACCLLHRAAVVTLPDRIAGPGGWLIDTSPRD